MAKEIPVYPGNGTETVMTFTSEDRRKLNEIHDIMLEVKKFLEEFDPSALLGALAGDSPMGAILGSFMKG